METPRLKLDFLHGIRGLAALYVVVFHLLINAPPPNHWPAPLRSAFHLLHHGYIAVAVFIVLSGFCLTLPLVRPGNTDLAFSGDVGGFLKRRAWRILPPYWGTLVVFWCFWRGIAGFSRIMTQSVDPGLLRMQEQALDAGTLLAHVLLVHNLFPQYSGAVTGILWTVALEWQIYFVFALVLVPFWRRLGLAATVGLAFLMGLAPVYFAPQFAFCNTWLLCLFSLGMAGAWFAQRPAAAKGAGREFPWSIPALAFAAAVVVHTLLRPHYYDGAATTTDRWTIDVLVGLATACALVYAVRRVTAAPAAPPVILRLLQARPVMRIADFSYSLYLTHGAVVLFMAQYTAMIALSPGRRFLVMQLVGLPFALAFAYVFYLVLERPTVSSRTGFRFGFRRPAVAVPEPAVRPSP